MMKYILIVLVLFFSANQMFSQDEVNIAKGDKELSQKNYQAAIIQYSKALTKNPNNFLVNYKRGNAYLYSNILDSAILDFNKFILNDSTSADAFNNRGVAYNYLGTYDIALADFNFAYNLDTSFTEALINRATAYFNLGLTKQAFDDFNKAEKMKDNNTQLYYQRGRLYYYMKNHTKAIEDFSKAIKLGLKNSKIYYNRGNAYFKSEQYEKAIKDYTKVIDLEPKDTEALNNRAVSYEKIGKANLAEKDRNKLKELVSKDPIFKPYENLTFKRYEDPQKLTSIELPEGWFYTIEESTDYIDIVISPEKISKVSDYFSAGVKISYNKNMMKQYKISQPDSLIDFWKGSINKNIEEYHLYKPLSQKMFKRLGFSCHTNKVTVKVTKESPTLKMYETAYAKDDNLIYLYLQSLEQQFSYYEKIFDKALESLIIK
jgi:tetratricopeptide (TPR) repeat protein